MAKKTDNDVKNKNPFDFGKPQDKRITSNGLQKLMNFFRIMPNSSNKSVYPTEPKVNKNGKETGEFTPINMPNDMRNLYQYLVGNMNTGLYMTNQYRMERYKDCKYAVTTEPLLNTALMIYISEAYSPENGKKPIVIHAKNKKVESHFYEWINQIGLTDNIIRGIFRDLTCFGDSFWINNVTENGIESITPLDSFLVANRIEFNINMVNQMKQWNQSSLNLINKYGSLKQIYDILSGNNLEDISQMYRSYLFGYELKLSADTDDGETKGVPPWCITHFRNFTTETDFFPFGKPTLLNAIPSFKSYRTTQMLIDMLRCATFPRENVKIKGEDEMDTFSRMQRVDEVRQFLEKITPNSQEDDLSSVGSRIYSMEDLFDIELLESDIDLDKIGDLEYKRTDMIMSTGIPDSYLNPSEGAGDLGGENAESLKYLNKIFQRRIESLRESFLEGLTECYRMELMLRKIGDGDKEEFELLMPNSVEDMNEDAIDKDSSTFEFAKDILDTLGTMVGLERGDSLPQEVVIDVLKTYLPVHSEKIKKWIKALYDYSDEVEEEKEKEQNSGEETEEDTSGTVKDPIIGKGGLLPAKPKHERKQLSESKLKRLYEIVENRNSMMDIYFECKKQRGIIDGNLGNATFFNNSYRLNDKYSSINLLKEQINMNKLQKIEESK